MTIRLFMLDDNIIKQQWFFEIVHYLNARGQDGDFVSGYGTDPEVFNKSVDANIVFDSLGCDDGIYLIDLVLKEKDSEVADLLKRIKACGKPWTERFFVEYEALEKSANKHLQEVAFYNGLASIVMVAAHVTSRPALLISSEAPTGRTFAIGSAGLAVLPGAFFPDTDLVSDVPEKKREDAIKLWAQRILALTDALAKVREATAGWFKLKEGWRDYDRDGLPHDFLFPIDDHKKCVRSVFPWIPEDCLWWATKGTATALHEGLKTVVGANTQWMGEFPERPLSLAGAYLLFLLALERKAPDRVSAFLVEDWRCFFRDGKACDRPSGGEEWLVKAKDCLSFAPDQNPNFAETTVRSLFEFFSNVIGRQDGPLGLGAFVAPTADRPCFSLELNWGDGDLGDLEESVRRRIAIVLDRDPGEGWSGGLPSGKTSGSLLRCVLALQAASHGFGANGSIRLANGGNDDLDEQGWLHVCGCGSD